MDGIGCRLETDQPVSRQFPIMHLGFVVQAGTAVYTWNPDSKYWSNSIQARPSKETDHFKAGRVYKGHLKHIFELKL